jgi:hypothetical protein
MLPMYLLFLTPTRSSQVICACGKNSLEFLSEKETHRLKNELHSSVNHAHIDTHDTVARYRGVEQSALYLAFENAGCSKQILQNIRDRQRTTTFDGRQIALDFGYDAEWMKPPKFRDALFNNPSGPLAFFEPASNKTIMFRMCPMCFSGPMAEAECGNLRSHHDQMQQGKHGRFLNANSCRQCGHLGQHINEYPLYNPRMMKLNPGELELLCAKDLVQGFDECLRKLPTISESIFQELPLGKTASLEATVNAARTAVVRYYLSTLSTSPLAASSFGGILWRALKSFRDNSDSNRLSASWRRCMASWKNPHCADMPNLPPLASAALFAAVYVPGMMPGFQHKDLSDEHTVAAFVDSSAYTPPSAAQAVALGFKRFFYKATLHFKKYSGTYCAFSFAVCLGLLEMRNGDDSVVKRTGSRVGSLLKDAAIALGIGIRSLLTNTYQYSFFCVFASFCWPCSCSDFDFCYGCGCNRCRLLYLFSLYLLICPAFFFCLDIFHSACTAA